MQRATTRLPIAQPKMLFIYDLLISAAVVTTVLPWHALLACAEAFTWEALRQRMGTNPVPDKQKARRILIHAVSVGEMAAAEPLTRELLRTRSDVEVVLTTGNRDGLNAGMRLQQRLPAVVSVQLLPWDPKFMMAPWISRLAPDMVLIVETELWPNFIRESHRLRIPVCIVNGRVYQDDVPRYRIARALFGQVFSHVDWIGVQDEPERERFLAMGARPAQIDVTGNIKFDASLPPDSASTPADDLLKPVPQLLVGGSTHHPEELWLLESFVELRKQFPTLRIAIAPRRTRRAAAIARLSKAFGLRTIQWSTSHHAPRQWDVLILDETGWLTTVYRYAAAVVIGGSFVNHGGQNPLEAAARNRAIVIGPDVRNFESIVRKLSRANAIIRLNSHRELTPALRALLDDPARQRELGGRAQATLESSRGVALRYARRLAAMIDAGDDFAASVEAAPTATHNGSSLPS